MDRKEKAVELKHNGHNCCQAVLCSFAEELDVPVETLRKLGAGFGVGMGCMEGTCGSLCGANMVLGLKTYEGRPILRDAAKLHQAFVKKSGASVCKELKGIETGVLLCDCDDCVRHSVEAAEEVLAGKN